MTIEPACPVPARNLSLSRLPGIQGDSKAANAHPLAVIAGKGS